jgi:hypothetical protein
MRKYLRRLMWCSAIAVGLGLMPAPSASAGDHPGPGGPGTPYVPSYPPAYVQPSCPAPVFPLPAPAPQQQFPSDLPRGEGTEQPQLPQLPQTPQAPTPDMGATAPPAGDTGAGAGDLGGPTSGDVASAGILGRADRLNRFNLFDNMAAIPTNRVWAGFQYLGHYETSRAFADSAGNPILASDVRRTEALYRAGVELAVSPRFSVAIQEQYITAAGENGDDAWARPQFMVKYALVMEKCTVVSAIFGVQPEIGSGTTAQERATTYYPGLLMYRAMGDNAFMQGGFQYGFSDRGYNTPDSLDYAISLGYWLYRAPQCECDRGLTGIIPQVEFFGSNIIRGGDRNVASNISGENIIGTTNFRNVYDLTIGSRFMFGDRMSLGTAFSFPLTGPDIRNAEFLSSLSLFF